MQEDAGVRREFQFPGDLWLPRRENRCRQPPNNHTSYDYHTPGVYTRARGVFSSHSLPRARVLSSARQPPPFSRPSSSLPALLQIARRTYPRASLEKNCRGFELLRVTPLSSFLSLARTFPRVFSRAARITIRYFSRSRFKLSRKVRIIIYWPYV